MFTYTIEPKLSLYDFLAFREGEKYFSPLFECSELQSLLILAELRVFFFCLSHRLQWLRAQGTARAIQAGYSFTSPQQADCKGQ